MARRSAGLLLHRHQGGGVEVLLVHPGGPFWQGKEVRAWSLPKGEIGEQEEPLAAAEREFAEELGRPAPPGERHDLGVVRQSGGKWVQAFAVAADFDAGELQPNLAEVEWPPRSGRRASFPEIDRAEWTPLELARERLVAAQAGFLDRLAALLEAPAGS